jgi:hypothetical protein
MIETYDERKARLALFALDAIKARSDYQNDVAAVKDRTVKLRLERLEREAVIQAPAPKKVRARRAAVVRERPASSTAKRSKKLKSSAG